MKSSADESFPPFDPPPASDAPPPSALPSPRDPAAPPPAGPDALAGQAASALSDWKDDLRRDFETWLAGLDEIPETDDTVDDAANDAPDLYSFYAQFAAASAEARKANRRTAEAMSQWGETLGRFESGLQPLRETAAQLAAAQPKAGQMSRAHCLMLVELLDRLHRLARAFATQPTVRRSWWSAGGDGRWRAAWDAQRSALDILAGHLEGLLAKEGVIRLPAHGQPFDPAAMMAVAVESDATRPAQTVLEEIAAGYSRHGELLRAAQVKVSRLP